MNQNYEKKDIFIIIGGGLVIIFEKRADPRFEQYSKDREVNIGFSERGIFAMKALGLEAFVFQNGSPYERIIEHAQNGKKKIIPMGNRNECIYPMSRSAVHNVLMTEIEKYSNICIHFNHELISYDIKKDQMIFQLQDNNQKLLNTSDYIVFGCDGIFSKIRSEINKISLINDHLQISDKCCISINITEPIDCKKKLEANCFHKWPRGNIILNAIPNNDKDKGLGFQFSIIMSLKQFYSIKNINDLNQLFEDKFPDLIDTFGKDCIKNLPASFKPSTFVTIKCSSYNYLDKVLIMGDAAHSMMPLHGQGMNCGFEDCVILDELISQNNIRIRDILQVFSEKRVDNCNTMVDLSMDKYNYNSNDLKRSWLFINRFQFDMYLNLLLGDFWLPINKMVRFTRIDYIKCLEYRKWQDRVICNVVNAIVLSLIAALFYNIVLYIQYIKPK